MLSKKEKIAVLFTIGVFAIQFVDIFFIHTNKSVFGDNLVARIIGIILVIVASKILDFDLKKYCFKSFGWLFEVLYGMMFAVVPIAFCFFLEYLYFRIKGYTDLSLSFITPNFNYFGDSNYRILAIIAYALVLLIGVVFKEMYFRGFLITQLSGKYGIVKANVIQSLFYSCLSVPYILYSVINGNFKNYSILITIYIIIAYPVNNFICGMKWGFYYRINGTIWMAISDHFFNNFILTCVFISSDRLPEKWFIFEVFAVQIISCLLFIPFYIYRDKINMMAAEDAAIGLEILRAGGDLYTPEEEKKLLESEDVINEQSLSENTEKFFGEFVDNYLRTDVLDLRDVKQLEDPVPADQVDSPPSEENFINSIKTIDVIDPIFENEGTNAEDVKEHPSNLSKEYFGEMLNNYLISGDQESEKSQPKSEESETKKNDKVDNSNARNISKLVKGYFDNEFDKHTF
jgi:membrane protease YdiL (CAAX protease family)